MPSSIFITTPPSLSFSSSLLPLRTPPHFSKSHFTLTKTQNPHFTLTTSQLATLPILSFSGAKVGETALDLKTAPPATARAVVHRALITDLQNRRRGTASTLTRAEVSGGGRKPYPQKKTGRARRGSSRTPLRPGGGVVFGPKPRDWGIKINCKEKRLAISTAISSAAVDTAAAAVVVVEEFGERFEERPRTREFIEAMRRWGVDPKEKSVFLMTEVPENVRLSSRNIGSLRMLTPRTLNLYDVLNADKLVLTPSAVDYLNERYGIDYVDDDNEDEDGEFEDVVEGDEGTEGEESADVVE